MIIKTFQLALLACVWETTAVQLRNNTTLQLDACPEHDAQSHTTTEEPALAQT